MKKVMITVIATGVSVFSFAQVNLGLQTTTQAAVNATAATTAATKATTVATQVTSSTVNAGLSKTAEVKTATSSTVNAGSKQALATTGEIKNDVKKAAAVNAGTAVSSSSQAQTNSNSNNASLIANGDLNAGANATINGGKIIDKTEGAAVATTKATTETAQAVKGQASSEIKSDVKAVKQTAASVKPAVNTQASAEAKTATQASVNNK
jgi:peptidoglycan DL-endopeptidase CwlO